MKKITIALLSSALTAAAFLLISHSRQKPESLQAPPAQVANAAASTQITELPSVEAPKLQEATTSAAAISPPVTNASVIPENKPAAPTNELSLAIAKLLAPETSYAEKQSLFKNLREGGKLDDAIDAVKKAAADNPGVAQYPTSAGELILQKLGVMSRQGAGLNEMGVLGMQADMYFDSALKSQPDNWEAQFYKAAAMAHWPLELNKSDEVVTRFSNLIDQQERNGSQPEYANTYVLLGDYYHKLGQDDRAAATYQLGLQKFPGNQSLTVKLQSH